MIHSDAARSRVVIVPAMLGFALKKASMFTNRISVQVEGFVENDPKITLLASSCISVHSVTDKHESCNQTKHDTIADRGYESTALEMNSQRSPNTEKFFHFH